MQDSSTTKKNSKFFYGVNWIGLQTLLWREVKRSLILSTQTLAPPLITSLLYIFIFGNILGSRIQEIVPGVSYIDFIVPGILMMNVISGSFSNTSSALFTGRFLNFIQELLVAPLSYVEMVLGYVLAGVVRGLLIGIGIYLIAIIFTTATIANFWSFLFFLFITSFLFSSLGGLIGLWAKTFDTVNLPNTYILLPLSFFGGVFHSISLLPETIARLTFLNPIFYMVNGIRGSMLGTSDVSPLIAGTITLILAVAAFIWCVQLFKKGYNLRS